MTTVTLDAEQLAAVSEAGRLALELGPPEEVAAQALALVTRLTGADAAALAAWDPVAGVHRTLADTGYAATTLAYLASPRFAADDGLRLVRGLRRPLRQCDLPGAQDHEPVRVLRAAGFREGVAQALRTCDGRHAGLLKLNTQRPRPLPAPTVATLGLLTHPLAAIVDAGRRAAAVAASLPAGVPLVLASPDGAVRRLAGRPPSPLLAPGTDAVAEGVQRANAQGASRFLVLDAGRAPWQVSALPAGPDAVIAVRPARPPLTVRELEVAALLVTGATNAQIAEALVVARSTVNRHLEHVLAKLEAPSRAAAAARVVADGLELVGRGPHGSAGRRVGRACAR